MTRLTSEWIEDIHINIDKYDDELEFKLGYGLEGLACLAAELDRKVFDDSVKADKIFIIPITSGQGAIGNFAESIKAICSKIGFNSTVTKSTDVAGYYEAIINRANIVFMADDNEFIAMNLKSGLIVNNNEATARGFFSAFKTIYSSSNLSERKVALIGAGKVGSIILKLMLESDIDVAVLEKNKKIINSLLQDKIKIIEKPEELIDYDIIFDTSSEGNFINMGMLKDGFWFIGPGVPIALSPQLLEENKAKIIHDFLPIGVSTMLAMALK